MAVLGDDGKGYDLARKLETCGVWRWWLGDSLYSTFLPSLSSPSSWDSFMSVDHHKSTPHIQLQLRARALLFDKATLSLYLSSDSIDSQLNPSYLQLHGDDVYFTLDEDGAPDSGQSKAQSQTLGQEDFPETWYNKFFENLASTKPYLLSFANRESERRNPSEMSNYLKLMERHKRKRIELKEDDYGGLANSSSEKSIQPCLMLSGSSLSNNETCFFPETMFMMNCVPDRAFAPRMTVAEEKKVEVFGVLDTLPQVATKSSIMLERLGLRPEYLSMEQGPGQSRSKIGMKGSEKQLSQEQAMEMSKKVVARVLMSMGFDGASEIPIEVLSQCLSCHVSKLGRMLKVLADSYRKQCSAMELIKMFLQAMGNSNLAALAEHVKDSRTVLRTNSQQSQNMQPQSTQSQNMQPQSTQHQLPLPQQQNTLQLPQQSPRQMHPQMLHMAHPQNLTLQQQQLDRLRRQQQTSSTHSLMNMDKDRPMVEVKLENPPDLPTDTSNTNTLGAINNRQLPMSLQQQNQFAALQRILGSSGNQIRQQTHMQMSPMQSPNMGAVRAPPVKVEGFQELMGGGDASSKQSSDENRLTSPSK